jgi:hypothetical protein
MEKYIWVFVGLVLTILSGCSSIPAKVTEDDSLVVIKTEFINPENLQLSHEMVFHYSDGYPDSWVGQYSWDYSLIVIRKPGVKLLSYGLQIQGGYRGNSPVYPANFPLPYEAGRIVITDFVLVQEIKKTGMNEQTTNHGFREITQQEKDDLMQKLINDGSFAAWKQ